MKCDKNMMLLYAVTDRAWIGNQTLVEQVKAALQGGVTCVQLREKFLDEEAFLSEALEISALCRMYGVPFIVNDNLTIAMQCNADGIHVGQNDMDVMQVRKIVGEQKIIGVSVHSLEEALAAVANGADYLGVGAMFATDTKPDATIVSTETLRDICDIVTIPVVAIGGINPSNIAQLAGSGVDGVALVSAIFGVKEIEQECRVLRQLSKEMREGYV